ncbi:NAD-dependent epimerase/dehydratase family protein [Escherichia coli]
MNICVAGALASERVVAMKRWANCWKKWAPSSSMLDLTELVSSQAKVMLAGVDTLWHCSSFTSPWGRRPLLIWPTCEPPVVLAEWAVAWGVRNFIHISSPSLYFDYHHHRDIKEDFVSHRFANEFARSKAASEEVIQLLAQANPNTRFTILRPQSALVRMTKCLSRAWRR